jgi:hypothetical protein
VIFVWVRFVSLQRIVVVSANVGVMYVVLNIYQYLLMEKGGCFPGEKGAFLERVLGKGGQGGEEAVLRAVGGRFLDLGRWSGGGLGFVDGPWTMGIIQELCGLRSLVCLWYVRNVFKIGCCML